MDIFEGKISTDIEVKMLMEKIGKPTKNQRWSHSEISEIIGERPPSSRYRTITDRWRRMVRRDFLCEIDAVSGEGFICLDDSGALRKGQKRARSGIRQFGKGMKVLSIVSRSDLPEEQKPVYDHTIQSAAKILAVSKQIERLLESKPCMDQDQK